MLNLLKKYWLFAVSAILLIANFAFLNYQKNRILDLQSKNEKLKIEIVNQNLLINQLEFINARQSEAIAEMEKNESEKANLDKELKGIREQILKDLKTNDEVINEPLRDSVDFIVKRLREKNANNQ